MLHLISLDTLRCFDAAAHSPSFRAAARAVALTPAALGQRIRQLEDHLEVRLFERTTRSVSLTSAGLAMVPRVKAALAAVEECVRAARGESTPAPVELTLGTRYELGLSFIVPMRDVIQNANPGVTLNYYFGSGSDLLLRVRNREIDCAVTSTRFSDPHLDAVRLHREDYVFVASAGLLKKQPFKDDADAEHHTLIDYSDELPLFRYWRDAEGGGDRLHFGRILRMGSVEVIRRMVLAGEGVAVLPAYLVKQDLASKALKKVMPDVEPAFDYFRLIFRANDPRRSLFDSISATLLSEPLR